MESWERWLRDLGLSEDVRVKLMKLGYPAVSYFAEAIWSSLKK